jgi:hypothetical protein
MRFWVTSRVWKESSPSTLAAVRCEEIDELFAFGLQVPRATLASKAGSTWQAHASTCGRDGLQRGVTSLRVAKIKQVELRPSASVSVCPPFLHLLV